MRAYLKTVEKKEDCYKKAFKAGRTTSWDVLKGKNGPGGKPATMKERSVAAQEAVNGFIETCMGWVPGSAVSEGKPSTASEEEKKAADDACKASHCEWICRVSVRSVHEQYHVWYDSNQRMWVVTFLVRYGAWGEGPQAMQQENIVGEIGAHDAEAQFLRDTIAEAERDGKCNNVRRTVDDKERQKRIDEASDRVKKYLDSLEKNP